MCKTIVGVGISMFIIIIIIVIIISISISICIYYLDHSLDSWYHDTPDSDRGAPGEHPQYTPARRQSTMRKQVASDKFRAHHSVNN
jgi:flagellar basal body-associated protein FliL